jgi:PHD finger-like domain-containing protein 5A
MENGVSLSFLSLSLGHHHSFCVDADEKNPSPPIASPVCDSYVRPETLVRICDECNFGTYGGRCIICGSPGKGFPPSPIPPPRLLYLLTHCAMCSPFLPTLSGISDAYYCAECTRLEKDRDGCPKIVNLGASRTDLFYERRRLGESVLMLVSHIHVAERLTGFKKG